jgi:hypothetical protein
MALADERIRDARRTLAVLLSAPQPVSADPASDGGSPGAVPSAHDGETDNEAGDGKSVLARLAYAPFRVGWRRGFNQICQRPCCSSAL